MEWPACQHTVECKTHAVQSGNKEGKETRKSRRLDRVGQKKAGCLCRKLLHYYVGGEPAAVAKRIDSDHATEGEDGGMFRENVI